MNWIRPCQVCGSQQATALYENRLAALAGLDLSYSVAACSECGFAFANRLPEPGVYGRYYRELSKYDFLPSADAVPAADRMRARALVDTCRKQVKSTGGIADLGCGAGVLLNAFRQAGWSRVSGIDPAPSAPEQARKLFGIESVRSGSLREAHAMLDFGALDLVCLTGVLEHLPELDEDLKRLTDHIGGQTKILIEVPALERFERAPCEPFGEFSLEHIQYFSSCSLVMLFARFGFIPISIGVLELPQGTTDSLIGLFERGTGKVGDFAQAHIDRYIESSELAFARALQRLQSDRAERIIVYGAGSHTCRLLPRMSAGAGGRICGVVDGNPNLHGKAVDRWTIQSPDALVQDPDATILVSSFRSQGSIAAGLKSRHKNPLLMLY